MRNYVTGTLNNLQFSRYALDCDIEIRDIYIYILSDKILALYLLVRKPSYSGHFATVTGTNTIGRIFSPILQSKDLLFPSYTFIRYVRFDRKCSVSFYFDPI